MLSFGFNNQSLAQNLSESQPNGGKIKISADTPSVPSYLSHSKKAKKQAAQQKKEQQKKATLWEIITKMMKALVLAIALFLGLIALFIKNKAKFETSSKSPISLAKAMKQDEGKVETETLKQPNLKPESISPEKQFRDLVFKFFNMNK